MSTDDILIRVLDSGVAAMTVIVLYRICMKLIEMNGK